MKLKQKYLIIFLLISSVPILLITLFTYNRYTSLVKQQTTQVAESIFEKSVNKTNDILRDLERISGTFQFYSDSEDSVVEQLKKYTKNDGSYSSYDLFQSNNKIKFTIDNFLYYYDFINGIFIFTPSGEVLGNSDKFNEIKTDYNPINDSWYIETLKKEGATYISEISTKDFILNAKPSILISKAMYDVYSKEFLGVLLIDCSADIFDLDSINTLPRSAVLTIENEYGDILYSNITDFSTRINEENKLFYSDNLNGNLTLTCLLDYSILYSEFSITQILIIIIGLLCAFLTIFLSILLSYTLTKPLTYLSKEMANKEQYKLIDNTAYLNRTDEVGIMYNEYNTMVERQALYIKTEYENKLIALDAQMRSLEAQIDSHFLYNTLESINSIAEIEGVEMISTMTMALGNMFRYSIKTKSELVTVMDELNHVKDYVTIQRIRFDNKFDLVIDIPTKLHDYKILKLILQPLVENALYHGLQYCHKGNTITIKAYTKENTIFIEVSDNGTGMTKLQLKNLQDLLNEEAKFTELGHRKSQSIGLKNIHSRIILYYGLGYGLSIHSEENIGTRVTIMLPIIHQED